MRIIWDFVVCNEVLIQYDGIETEIAVPSDIHRINTAAFGRDKARKYQRIVLGNNVNTLDDETFYNSYVEELVVSSSVINISPTVFHNSNGKGVGKIICAPCSPLIDIGLLYGIKTEIVSDETINCLYNELMHEYMSRRSKYALCCGQVIVRHPIYTMLKETDMHDPSWDELQDLSIKYQNFLCLNGNENIIENFRDIVSVEALSSVLPRRVLEKYTDEEMWALFAITVGCMTPIMAVTDYGYIFLDRTMTPSLIKAEHPIFNCYKYLCGFDEQTREQYLKMLKDNVIPLEGAVLSRYLREKKLEASHTKYLQRLYCECSRAQDDEQREVYNILIAILNIFSLRYYKSKARMLKNIKNL